MNGTVGLRKLVFATAAATCRATTVGRLLAIAPCTIAQLPAAIRTLTEPCG